MEKLFIFCPHHLHIRRRRDEELFSDIVAFLSEPGVVPGRELVLSWRPLRYGPTFRKVSSVDISLHKNLLVVPSRLHYATDSLHPFVDFPRFIPLLPAQSRTSHAIFSKSKHWWGIWLNRLYFLSRSLRPEGCKASPFCLRSVDEGIGLCQDGACGVKGLLEYCELEHEGALGGRNTPCLQLGSRCEDERKTTATRLCEGQSHLRLE